jgi:hypothetical protein
MRALEKVDLRFISINFQFLFNYSIQTKVTVARAVNSQKIVMQIFSWRFCKKRKIHYWLIEVKENENSSSNS